jgi:hypothetical protein
MNEHWIELYRGPFWQAKILQVQLDGHDIPNFVTEPFFQTPYPFGIAGVAGPDAFVLVPPEREKAARALLHHAREKPVEQDPS